MDASRQSSWSIDDVASQSKMMTARRAVSDRDSIDFCVEYVQGGTAETSPLICGKSEPEVVADKACADPRV